MSLKENETDENATVAIIVDDARVTCELINLVYVNGKPFSILQVVDGPAPGVIVRGYALNEDHHAVVPPLDDPELAETVLDDYIQQFLSAA